MYLCGWTGAWAHVALLIQHTTRMRHTVTSFWPLWLNQESLWHLKCNFQRFRATYTILLLIIQLQATNIICQHLLQRLLRVFRLSILSSVGKRWNTDQTTYIKFSTYLTVNTHRPRQNDVPVKSCLGKWSVLIEWITKHINILFRTKELLYC